jgi:Mn2+/Fe2+ NRAMP family transporter
MNMFPIPFPNLVGDSYEGGHWLGSFALYALEESGCEKVKNWLKNIGPGVLVSAAFIGPGTVTVCTLAGVNFQYALLWALLLICYCLYNIAGNGRKAGIISQKA